MNLPLGFSASGNTRPALLILAVATLCSVMLRGFDYPRGNNVYHVPIVLDYAGSQEGPADEFHTSLDRYVTLVWPALSLVATESNVYWLFLGGLFIARFMTILLIWRIAVLFGGNSSISALMASCLLFLSAGAGYSPLGRTEMLLTSYFTHSLAVIPFVIWSWLLLYRRRFIFAALIAGVAVNLNAFMGIWAAVVIGVGMLVARSDQPRIQLAKTAATMAGVFVIAGLPTIVWILRAVTEVAPHEAFSYGQYLRDYYPFHSFIDADLPRSTSFVAGVVVGFALFDHVSVSWEKVNRALVLSTLVTLVAIMVFGGVLPFVTDSRVLINLFPLRMDMYWITIQWTLLLVWCLQAWRGDDPKEWALSLIALFSAANGNSVLLAEALVLAGLGKPETRWSSRMLAAVVLAMGIIHVYFATPPNLLEVNYLRPVYFFAAQGLIVAIALRGTPDHLYTGTLLIAGSLIGMIFPSQEWPQLVAAGLLYLVVLIGIMRFERRQLIMTVAIVAELFAGAMAGASSLIAVVLVLVLLFGARFVGLSNDSRVTRLPRGSFSNLIWAVYVGFLVLSLVQLSRRGSIAEHPDAVQALSEASLWARDHTPPHTMFLPVGVKSFTVESRRPVWTDWKYGAMVMWYPEAHANWARRWDELSRIQTVSDAVELAREQGIDYIVFRRDLVSTETAPAECIVFENSTYWIMRGCRDLVPLQTVR